MGFRPGVRPDVLCARQQLHEVWTASPTWFDERGYSGTSTTAITENDPSSSDIDIVFNSGKSWSTSVPSNINNTDRSIGQVALHEFGHALGFNHEEDVAATMNGTYPHGGDISGFKYRPNEDDYVGLVANRPHASTGTNLMLGRYVHGSGEQWDDATARWTVCDQTVLSSADGPEGIYAIVYTTSSSVSAVVEWSLSTDTTCFAGVEYVVGSRTYTLSADQPALVQPLSYNFTGVPAGSYYMCAMIDPDNLIAETASSDADNDLVSQAQVTVLNCP